MEKRLVENSRLYVFVGVASCVSDRFEDILEKISAFVVCEAVLCT